MVTQPSSHSLELRNDLSELERMSVWLHVTGKLMGLADAILADLDLCAAEAVHNIIAYAYEDSSPHRIQVRLSRGADYVNLEVEDDGTPFNPLEYPRAPSVSRLEQAPLGGRGIHLIRDLMTECSYRRNDGNNILTMARAF